MREKDQEILRVIGIGAEWFKIPTMYLRGNMEYGYIGSANTPTSQYRILISKHPETLVITLDYRPNNGDKKAQWLGVSSWVSTEKDDRPTILKVFNIARNGAFHFPLY